MTPVSVPSPRFGSSLILDILARCQQVGGVDLATGIPTTPADPDAVDGAIHAMRAGANTYAPSRGLPALREAIARQLQRDHGLVYDPATELLVASGITGAFSAAMLSLFTPGDEVLLVEPYFDFHVTMVRLAGLTPRFLRLHAPAYALGRDALEAALGARTRGLLLCTPSNPGGKVYTREELAMIAEVAQARDLVVVTDEQYAAFCYDGAEHVAPAAIEGLRERTVTIQGFSKSLSITGWRQAFAAGPAHMIEAMTCIHQALYICAATPLQHGVLRALQADTDRQQAARDDFARKRDQLAAALREAGFTVHLPQGGFFLMADASGLAKGAAEDVAAVLLDQYGVAAVPGRAFYSDTSMDHVLRFCFAKRDDELDEACARLGRLSAARKAAPAPLTRTPHRSVGRQDGVRRLWDETDRQAAARLAYEVYVEEFGILGHLADHEAGTLMADDEGAVTFGLFEGGELVGAFSSFCWADTPFPAFYQRVLGVDDFREVTPPERWAVLSRLLVKPGQRGGTVALTLVGAMIEHLLRRGIDLLFADCQPHLLGLYLRLGLRAYGRPFDYGDSGMGIPLVGSMVDIEYLQRTRSLMYGMMARVPHDAAQAAALGRVLASRDPLCSASWRPQVYQAAIATMLEGRAGRPGPDPFYGFTTDELRAVLGQGFVLEVDQGIKLIARGQATRSVFVVVDGALEARFDGGQRALGPGDILGEVAFLSRSRRTADVVVHSPQARVLCLSESTLSELIRGEPRLAARLLGNLARVLAWRLGTR